VLSVLPVDLSETALRPQVPLIRSGDVVTTFDVQHARDRCEDRRARLRSRDRRPDPAASAAIPTTWIGIEIEEELS